VTAKGPRTVIDHILQYGAVTTEELQTLYGYDHPPRAVRDVRERGVPIQTFRVGSEKTGRMIAAYRFDSPDKIVRGRISGRKAFSKGFKNLLIEHYGPRDAITGEPDEDSLKPICSWMLRASGESPGPASSAGTGRKTGTKLSAGAASGLLRSTTHTLLGRMCGLSIIKRLLAPDLG